MCKSSSWNQRVNRATSAGMSLSRDELSAEEILLIVPTRSSDSVFSAQSTHAHAASKLKARRKKSASQKRTAHGKYM